MSEESGVHEDRTEGQETAATSEGTARVRGGSFLDNPRPYIARLSRRAFLGAALVGLVILTVLSFRYSRESMAPGPEPRELSGPPPLGAEQLESLRPPSESAAPAWDLRQEPPEERPEEPAALPVRPHRPAAHPQARRNPPLAVSLPGRSQGRGREETAPGSQRAEVAERLARQRRLLAGTREAASPETAPGDPRQLAAAEANAVRVTWQAPPTRCVLEAGTYVPAVLTQAVTSEIGGPVRARIIQDLWDSTHLAHVLIPRGTLALGRQSRQPLLGERRLMITWERLILPDGRSLDLASEPAAHADGTLGARGRVNRRWGQRFGAAALLSVVGAGFQLAQPQRSGEFGQAASPGQVAAGALGLQLGQLSERVLQQFVDLPPIVSLEPGARVHMLLTRDLAFDRPQP